MKSYFLLLIGVLFSVDSFGQNKCQQAFQRIIDKYPEAKVAIEGRRIMNVSELEDCTERTFQTLDSLFIKMEAMPPLTEEDIKYLRDGLKRVNQKYNSSFELDEKSIALLRFYEERDWDMILDYAEQDARRTYELQIALNRRSEIRDSMYKNVIDPLLRAAKTDDDRRAIAEKYPEYVRYHDSCPPEKEQ